MILRTIIICLLLSLIMVAKNNEFGLRLEFYTYNLENISIQGEYNSKQIYLSLPGFYVFYSHKILDQFSLSFKPGIMISDEDISGFDLGSFIRYNFERNNIYLFTGVNLIYLNDPGGGQSLIEDFSSPISLFNIGIGYSFNKHIRIDFNYSLPFDKNIGKTYLDPDDNNLNRIAIKLHNLVKLSFEFSI